MTKWSQSFVHGTIERVSELIGTKQQPCRRMFTANLNTTQSYLTIVSKCRVDEVPGQGEVALPLLFFSLFFTMFSSFFLNFSILLNEYPEGHIVLKGVID